MFTIGRCAIIGKATLQNTMVLSTIEAKCTAITKACKEAIWLMELFGKISKNSRCLQFFVRVLLRTFMCGIILFVM